MSVTAERLWALLPAIYRIRDEEQGGALREIVEVIAGQVAAIEEELDQPIDHLGDRRQGDPERARQVGHQRARVALELEEHLGLRVGEVELQGLLPEDLAEGRRQQGRQELAQVPGVAGQVVAHARPNH